MHELWQQCQASIVSLTFQNADGRMSSGTGFKVGSFLITNNHVMHVPGFKRMSMRSVQADGHTTAYEEEFGHLQFRDMLEDGDQEAGWDYAVLRVPGLSFSTLPSLELQPSDHVQVGSAVALFGYQFDNPNLSIHAGHLSSQYQKAGVHYLQLDCSVNQGNSGGPLIDVATGKVLGIVTRKATGLTEQFDVLVAALDRNIQALDASQRGGGQVRLMGIDPIGAIRESQAQMGVLAREIRRSANVGVGYAYQIRKVREALARLA